MPVGGKQAQTLHDELGMRGFGLIASLVAVALFVGVIWYVTEGTNTGQEGLVGTTGTLRDEDDSNGNGVIHELDTITGMNDAQELVGRRVDLHVPIQQHLNDVAFWVGSKDNRLLVVLARDTRGGATRQRGEPSSHGLDAQYEGEMATISGTVQPLPKPEEMYSWALTEVDRKALLDRRVYIRADTVTPHFSTSTGPQSPRAGTSSP